MLPTVTLHNLTFEIFLTKEQIQSRVAELGEQLEAAYADRRPLFLGVLNGSFIFTADLVRACTMDCEASFVRLASYQGVASSGEVTTVIGLPDDLKGRHVIVVEDIIDSGRTMNYFLQQLGALQPASVALIALLHKPDAEQLPTKIDYLGFSIPDQFVVGYGLDYDGLGRNLPHIYQLKK